MGNEDILKKISLIIHSKDSDAEAYLFGSRARGDFHAQSDWDILILVNKEKISMEVEDMFRNDLYDLELDTGLVISSFIYPKNYWTTYLTQSPLYHAISNEGIKL